MTRSLSSDSSLMRSSLVWGLPGTINPMQNLIKRSCNLYLIVPSDAIAIPLNIQTLLAILSASSKNTIFTCSKQFLAEQQTYVSYC